MLRRLLQVMAYRLPMLLLAGRHCLSSRWPFVLTFPQMPIAQRHAMLMSWACSPLPELRQVGSEPEGFSKHPAALTHTSRRAVHAADCDRSS
jgi:hypothetical protein